MKNLNVFEIKTSSWKEENFYLMTNLTQEQIKKIIEPMVDYEKDNDFIHSNDDYVEALQLKYPKAIVVHYVAFELIEF